MMKNHSRIIIPAAIFASLILLVNTSGIEVYSQQSQNMSQPHSSNQTSQSQNMSQQQSQTEMKEKILNFTNMAIIALEDDNEDVVEENLRQIQGTILNSTDKQIVIVPSTVME